MMGDGIISLHNLALETLFNIATLNIYAGILFHSIENFNALIPN